MPSERAPAVGVAPAPGAAVSLALLPPGAAACQGRRGQRSRRPGAGAGALAALPAAGADIAFEPAGELPWTRLSDAAASAPSDALAEVRSTRWTKTAEHLGTSPEDESEDELAAGHSLLRAAAKAPMNRKSTAAASAASSGASRGRESGSLCRLGGTKPIGLSGHEQLGRDIVERQIRRGLLAHHGPRLGPAPPRCRDRANAAAAGVATARAPAAVSAEPVRGFARTQPGAARPAAACPAPNDSAGSPLAAGLQAGAVPVLRSAEPGPARTLSGALAPKFGGRARCAGGGNRCSRRGARHEALRRRGWLASALAPGAVLAAAGATIGISVQRPGSTADGCMGVAPPCSQRSGQDSIGQGRAAVTYRPARSHQPGRRWPVPRRAWRERRSSGWAAAARAQTAPAPRAMTPEPRACAWPRRCRAGGQQTVDMIGSAAGHLVELLTGRRILCLARAG